MKIHKRTTLGFTLIELLIVIAIIGILATLLITNLQGVRERARDARRKSDLNSIQQSLRLYYNDAGSFPLASSYSIVGCGSLAVPTTCNWGERFYTTSGSTTNTYMSVLPLDPSTTETSEATYQYYTPDGGYTYIVVAKLENLSDPGIAESQARCPVTYAAYISVTSDDTSQDYVVCEE